MTFKNEKQLKDFLLKKSQVALTKAQEKVYKIIDKFLDDFYADYTPSDSGWGYQRTGQLLHSLVKTEVVPNGSGYKAEIYFDLNSLSYSKPAWQGGEPPSGEQVFEAAKQGLHGAIGDAGSGWKKWEYHYEFGKTGVNIWSDPIKVLDAEAIEILKNMLIAEGIPIK